MTQTFVCRRCGEPHEGPPFAWAFEAPAYWSEELAARDDSVLGEEQCVVAGEHFFARGRIVLPVHDASEDFEWGVWVSLSEQNFERMSELWETPGRESEPPYFGWLSTELAPVYPSTLSLKTDVHTQPVGERPLVVVQPSGHPLAAEQRDGIPLARVHEFAEVLLHDAR